MLVTEFLEFGDLWRALPLTNAAGQRIFAWHKRCVGARVAPLCARQAVRTLEHAMCCGQPASRPTCFEILL